MHEASWTRPRITNPSRGRRPLGGRQKNLRRWSLLFTENSLRWEAYRMRNVAGTPATPMAAWTMASVKIATPAWRSR